MSNFLKGHHLALFLTPILMASSLVNADTQTSAAPRRRPKWPVGI